MKLLITGVSGLLGSEIRVVAKDRACEVVGVGHGDLDVRDADAVLATVARARPDVVVHCAAYTNVDQAEDEPDLAMAVNRDGTRHVAESVRQVGARLVYLSTNYVFDGEREEPYRPDDTPSPRSVYGRTKLEGELVAREVVPDVLIARAGWLYGSARSNFVTAILARAARGESLRVVDDQIGGPTWTLHLAQTVMDLVEGGAQGVFHVANRGVCTWLDLAREAIGLRGLGAEILGVSSEVWGARGPALGTQPWISRRRRDDLVGKCLIGGRRCPTSSRRHREAE